MKYGATSCGATDVCAREIYSSSSNGLVLIRSRIIIVAKRAKSCLSTWRLYCGRELLRKRLIKI